MRKYCGTVKFYNNHFDVHWDADTKKVYISKLNNPELSLIHYSDFRADDPEEAPKVALQLLATVLGKEMK